MESNNANTLTFAVPYDEFRVWRQQIFPQISGANQNAEDILEYVTTELLNNGKDHSRADRVFVTLNNMSESVRIAIADTGIGVFTNICNYFKLESGTDAVIQLMKGKCTTNPNHHSGEGLFFSIHATDSLEIKSGKYRLLVDHERARIEKLAEPVTGSKVVFSVNKNTATNLTTLFNDFCHEDQNGVFVFDRTIFVTQLAEEGGSLVARSQGKRVMAGMERFKFVELDFIGVNRVGQGFADEIFRVWINSHPDTKVTVVHAVPDVEMMISRTGFDDFPVKPEQF